MCFEPMQAERFDLADKPFNHSATLSDQRSFNGKLNRNNEKLKQRCFPSNRIFFFVQNKENLSSQTIVRSKIDLTSVYLKINNEFCTLVLVQD